MQTGKNIKGTLKRKDIFVDGITPACYNGNVSDHSVPSALLSACSHSTSIAHRLLPCIWNAVIAYGARVQVPKTSYAP
jgi:hypothetical protein